MDGANGDMPPRGVLYAPLIETHPDRIVVGDCTLFLGDGMACSYPLGTPLDVEYVEQNGRRRAEKITPIPVGSSAQMRGRLSRGGVWTSR
jgi:hypothetical protein